MVSLLLGDLAEQLATDNINPLTPDRTLGIGHITYFLSLRDGCHKARPLFRDISTLNS